jgi:hypothetical protein
LPAAKPIIKNRGARLKPELRVEHLAERLQRALSNAKVSPYVGVALLRDFIKSINECFTKSGKNHLNFFHEVTHVLGVRTAFDIAELIDFKLPKLAGQPWEKYSVLDEGTSLSCKERGVEVANGRHLFCGFVKSLIDVRSIPTSYNESTMALLHRTLDDEAAYHFVCLLSGDDGMVEREVLKMVDGRAFRFRKTVEQWELEVQWDKENQALDGKYLETK